MAGTAGNTSAALTTELLKKGTSFPFFQALRLLERINADSGEAPGSIRIRPVLSLELCLSEVATIRSLPEGTGFELLTSIPGLYGAASPVPAHLTERLVKAELDDRPGARALLDGIHTHLYRLFFDGLKHYRPWCNAVEGSAPDLWEVLFSLAGMRDTALQELSSDPAGLLRYIGLFTQQPRSAMGLKTLLNDAFPEIPVEVEQCVPHKAVIPRAQRLSLGDRGSRLGMSALIGEEIDSRTNIRIRVGPVNRQQFHDLQGKTEEWSKLFLLTHLYLTDPVACELELVLAEGEAETARLGHAEWSRLGMNTWLFSGKKEEPTRARFRLNTGSG